MNIKVEFEDFDDMLGFARQLLEGQEGTGKQTAGPSAGQVPAAQGAAVYPVPAVPVSAAPAAPVVQAPAAPAVPVAQAPVQPAAAPIPPVSVPSSIKEYTVDELASAAIPLMDAGGQQALVNLLSQFGVSAIPELPAEQRGAFATALRGMGAKI